MKLTESEQINILKEKYEKLLAMKDQQKSYNSALLETEYNQFLDMDDIDKFFKDCIEAAKKQLFKEYELNKSLNRSQSGSLLYELKRNKEIIPNQIGRAHV